MIKYEPYEPRGLILWRFKKLDANDVWVAIWGITILVLLSIYAYFVVQQL